MVLSEFPDLTWLKKQAELSFSNKKDWRGNDLKQQGWPNVVLNVKSQFCHRDNIRGPLSIFTNLTGESSVEVEKKRTKVREGFYYVSNQDQYYTLDIDPKSNTETFNIHFGQFFVDGLFHALTVQPEFLLDNTFDPGKRVPEFHNRLNFRSKDFDNVIRKIKLENNMPSIKLEEALSDLASMLISEELKWQGQLKNIPAIRSTTKVEVLKRLTCAVDFIYSSYNTELSLDQLAGVCCLSKFHFLRLFKLVYQKTPGEFLDEVRIKKAMEALTKKTSSIKNLAHDLGYKNSSSFSRMFKNQVGVYPTHFI